MCLMDQGTEIANKKGTSSTSFLREKTFKIVFIVSQMHNINEFNLMINRIYSSCITIIFGVWLL